MIKIYGQEFTVEQIPNIPDNILAKVSIEGFNKIIDRYNKFIETTINTTTPDETFTDDDEMYIDVKKPMNDFIKRYKKNNEKNMHIILIYFPDRTISKYKNTIIKYLNTNPLSVEYIQKLHKALVNGGLQFTTAEVKKIRSDILFTILNCASKNQSPKQRKINTRNLDNIFADIDDVEHPGISFITKKYELFLINILMAINNLYYKGKNYMKVVLNEYINILDSRMNLFPTKIIKIQQDELINKLMNYTISMPLLSNKNQNSNYLSGLNIKMGDIRNTSSDSDTSNYRYFKYTDILQRPYNKLVGYITINLPLMCYMSINKIILEYGLHPSELTNEGIKIKTIINNSQIIDIYSKRNEPENDIYNNIYSITQQMDGTSCNWITIWLTKNDKNIDFVFKNIQIYGMAIIMTND